MLLQGGSGGGLHVERARARRGEIPRTAEDGWTEFIVPEGQEFDVKVLGRAMATSSHVPVLARGQTHEIVLRVPTQENLVFFGRVVAAEDRTPLRGASAFLRTEGEPESTVLSDANGFFFLQAATWRNDRGEVRAPGFAPVIFDVAEGHSSVTEALEVALQRGASIKARVTDPSGNPLSLTGVTVSTNGFRIFLEERSGASETSVSVEDPRWTAMTDDDGRCAFEDLPPSVPLSVQVHFPGSKPFPQSTLTLQPGEVREVVWIGSGGTVLRGLIVDQSGAPVADQRILLLHHETDDRVAQRLLQGWEDPVAEARSDAQGRFTFSPVAPGTWWIGPAPEDPTGRLIRPLALELLAQLEPALGKSEGSPDPPDKILEDRRVVSLATPIEVGLVSPQEVLLRAERGLYIRGRVFDSRGAPAEGFVTAHAETKDIAGFSVFASVEAGAFSVGPLTPGRWILTASGLERTAGQSEPVVAIAGQQGVVLRLAAASRIQGEIVGAGRDPSRNEFEVILSPAESDGSYAYGSDTGSGFEFGGVLPGTYAILARAEVDQVGWLAGIQVAPGEERTGLRIHLGTGARLRIRNRSDRDGYLEIRMEGYSIELLDAVAEGAFSICLLPGGRAEIRLLQDEGDVPVELDRIEVDLVPGEEREVAFEEER
ncbi:MAG TPA: carboxypeptidase-like regulatory domain-containing protein [Planctomycetota bacterium]|nr:carboxypeptidase-like regulatory domain-containing protein [Planctomycetota bacterium]